jgi:hypothetical protein
MEKKKAYEQPKAGIFYLIPDPKKESAYTFYSQVQEEPGRDITHLFLFDKVKQILEMRFKVSLDDPYTGIPRGRIMEPRIHTVIGLSPMEETSHLISTRKTSSLWV